jgi:cytochrome c biogenesis protein CcmG/thiol:disulfide interchange protein DsbE
VGAIGLLALLALGLRFRAGTDRTAADSPLIGRRAPDFSLPVLTGPGPALGNRDLLGEPFLLAAWDTRCADCAAAHAQLVELALDARVHVRIVGLVRGDPPAAARRWLAARGNPYYAVVLDRDGRAARAWGIRAAPEAFLVDSRGVVRWRHVGPITPDVVADDILPTLESAR